MSKAQVGNKAGPQGLVAWLERANVTTTRSG